MLDIEFTVDMAPTGKARPRMGRFGMYTPKKTHDAEDIITYAAQQRMGGCSPTTDNVVMMVVVIFPIPQSYRGKKRSMAESGRLLPGKKPDIDNLVKLAADAMNGIVYVDDAQVCRLVAEKKCGRRGEHAEIWPVWKC